MISAIISNWEFLWLIIEDTGSSNLFWNFICILNYAINNLKMMESSECIIMLDNVSIHSSNQTLKRIEKININCEFLPGFSPSLAPVELFFRMIKNKLRKTLHTQGIKFNKQIDRIKIYSSIENLRRD